MPSCSYYYKLEHTGEPDYEKIPLAEETAENKLNDEIVFNLYNPYKLNPLPEGEYYYFQLRFNSSEFTEKGMMAGIKYKYENITQNTTTLEKYETGIYYIPKLKKKESLTLKLVDKKDYNTESKIQIGIRWCIDDLVNQDFEIKLSEMAISFHSYAHNYRLYEFSTFSDFLIKTGTSLDEEDYNGVYFHFGVNMTQKDIEQVGNLMRKESHLKVVRYSREKGALVWEKVDEALYYDIFIMNNTNPSQEYINNDCFLIALKENKTENGGIFIGRTSENSFPYTVTKDIVVKVVAIIESPIAIRMKFPTSYVYLKNIQDYKTLKEGEVVELSATNLIFVLPKVKESHKWKYFEFNITDIDTEYFIKFASAKKKEDMILPDVEKEEPLDPKEKDGRFVFQYPFDSSDDIFYFGLLPMPKPKVTKYPKISYLLVDKQVDTPKGLKVDDNFLVAYSSEILGKEFIMNKNIAFNKRNDVSFLAKKCNPKEDAYISVYSSRKKLMRKLITESHDLLGDVETTTDLTTILTSDEETFSGIIFSYAANLTNIDKINIHKYIGKGISPKLDYNKETRILSWEGIDDKFSYEIYYLQNTTENENLVKSDCYLLSKKGGEAKYIESNKDSVNFDKPGGFVVTVVGVIKKPIPLRINYGTINIYIEKSIRHYMLIISVIVVSVIILLLIIGFYVIRSRRRKKESGKDPLLEVKENDAVYDDDNELK